jgi:hypothetical protein
MATATMMGIYKGEFMVFVGILLGLDGNMLVFYWDVRYCMQCGPPPVMFVGLDSPQ